MGEVGAVPIDANVCLGQRTVLLQLDNSRIDSRFLKCFLMTPFTQAWVQGNSAGSTVLHLNVADVRRIPIPWLPALTEQRRIVDILEDHLSRLDAADAYVRASRRRLRTLVKSVLLGLIPHVDAYPSGWRSTTIGEAGRVGLGRQRHPDWHTGSNMHRYLRVANVFEDRIDVSDIKEMHWPDTTFERFRLEPGDVLLNEGQTPDLLGRPAIYRGVPRDVAFTNSLIRFQAAEDLLPEFALLVFRRHMHAGRFKRESRITTNIAHLSAARLKPIEFPVPPLDVQRRIVDCADERLGDVGVIANSLAVQEKRSDALRRSLLAAAFSGKLTDQVISLDRAEELANA